MNKIKAIALQEVRAVIFSPMFFVIALLCSTVWTYTFLRSVMTFAELSSLPSYYSRGPLSLHYQVIEGHISLVNLLFIFAIPALTMRLLSSEKRNKTFELLLTSPLTSLQIALGKFLGGFLIASILVVIALLYPLGLRAFADFSLLPLLSTAIGVLFLTGMYVALGLFASSLTSSPVLSVILGIVFNLFLWLISLSTTAVTNPIWSEILRQMSVPQQFYVFLKGTLNISATVFFLSLIGFFIFLCERIIESSRWGFGGLKMKKPAFIMWMVSVISLGILFVVRTILGGWVDLLFVPLALFLLAFCLAIFLDISYYFEFLRMRTARLGLNMGILIIGSVIFVIAINFLSVRNNASLDMTEEKLFTLSPKTKKVLKAAKDQKIKIHVFYRGLRDSQQKQQLQEELSLYSSQYRHIDVEFIDAYENSEKAKEYKLPQTEGVNIFIETQQQRIRVTPPFNEQNMAMAFIKATREKKHKILYATGHGERTLDPEKENGAGLLEVAIKDSGFELETFDFLTNPEISKDAGAVLMIVGPRRPYSKGEIERLKNFVDSGGRLFVAIDPGENHNLQGLLDKLSIRFKNNYVINFSPRLQGRGVAGVVGLKFGNHPIVEEIAKQQRPYTFFDFASALEETEAEGYIATPLVYSASTSFAVNDLSKAQQPKRVQKEQILGVAVDAKEGKGKSILFGDSDFLSNRDFGFAFNRDLALSSISYLLEEKDLIQVEPKRIKSTQLVMSSYQRVGLVVGSLLPPILALCFAVGLWVRRKSA